MREGQEGNWRGWKERGRGKHRRKERRWKGSWGRGEGAEGRPVDVEVPHDGTDSAAQFQDGGGVHAEDGASVSQDWADG